MADHYGSSEIIAGHYRSKFGNKDQVQYLTKWVPTPGPINRKDVRSAVQLSLDRLQQSSIDLMQFHAWNYPDPSWLDGLFYLNELRDEGLIRHIGVTNFDTAHLRIAITSGIPIVSNQLSYSLLDQRAHGKMKSLCHEHDIKILAFGTLAGGFLTERWLDKKEPVEEKLSSWSEMKYKRYIDTIGGWDVFQNLLQAINKVAVRRNVTMANVASRFILDNEEVAAVIIGAKVGLRDYIDSNKQMLDFKLDLEDREIIKLALKVLSPIPGDCGDEYRKAPFLTASGDLSHHIESFPDIYTVNQISEFKSQVFSGTVWEDIAAYCRAFKDGNRIYVSGTTATHGDKMIGGKDVAAQTHFIIDKIEGAIMSLGGRLADVVRTRIFINDINDWEAAARAHGERFKHINPANTLVKAELVGEGYLVEIEAEAVVH